MQKKALPRHTPDPEIAKELEHLYEQLSAVEALIRALKEYRQFYPNLIRREGKTA